MTITTHASATQRFFNFIRAEIVRWLLSKRIRLLFILIAFDGIFFIYLQPMNTNINALTALLQSLIVLFTFLPVLANFSPMSDFSSHYDITLRTFFRYPATYVSARLITSCIFSFIFSIGTLGFDFLCFLYLFPLNASVHNYVFSLSGKVFVAAILISICFSVGILAMVLLFRNRFIGFIAYGVFFIFFPWLVGLFLPQNIALRTIPILAAVNIFSPQILPSLQNTLYWQNIGVIFGWTLILIAVCLILISVLPNRRPPRFIQNIVNRGPIASRFLR